MLRHSERGHKSLVLLEPFHEEQGALRCIHIHCGWTGGMHIFDDDTQEARLPW